MASLLSLLDVIYMVGGWALVPSILQKSGIFEEVRASILTGFGGGLLQPLVFLLICVVLYFIQRRRAFGSGLTTRCS